MLGLKKINHILSNWYHLPENSSENRYRKLRRNIAMLRLAVTLLPLIIMAGINYHQYRNSIEEETITQLKVLENKTKHTLEEGIKGPRTMP